MISYIIQVSISWIFFYGVYHLFLRKETFFNVNRFYLMGSLILSLFIPQIGELLSHFFTASPADAGTVVYFISEAPIAIENVVVSEASALSFLEWSLLLIYLTGIGVTGTRFLLGIRRIFRLYTSGTKKDNGAFVLVETNGVHLPFSFFQYVFISKNIPLKNHIEKIIRHELTHVEKLHSLDILLIEALYIFFWFNPVLLLYKKAIRQSHEYQADASVLTGTDIKNYGQILLGQSTSGLEVALANHFFNSQIKNRITMMYQKKSTRSALIKYLAAVPVLLFMAFLFSNATQLEIDGLSDSPETDYFTVSSDTIPPPPPPVPLKGKKHPTANKYSGEVFTEVENMPRFPGCEDLNEEERDKCSKKKMLEYIYNNLKYPKEAKDAGIQGMVVIQFVVNKDGTIRDATLLRDIGGECGITAKAVIESMNSMSETWIAGVQNGKKVDVLYTIPVRFKLSEDKKDQEKEENGNIDPNTVKMDLDDFADRTNSLVIIDNVESPKEILKTINPDDILIVNVLKGDEAKAKYGNKAGDGVVEVFTNRKVDASKESSPGMKFLLPNEKEQPLYVLDGEIVTPDVKNDFNPDDIESINVYKGEKATEKYGDKAKYGVVEITSKGNKSIKLKADKITIKNPKVKLEADKIQYQNDGKEKLDISLTANEGQPLYVVDGKEMKQETLDLDPDNIKSINVLKGEKAFEKYGDKAKNGVIEITTKDKADISNEVFSQVEQMPRFPGCEDAAMSDKERDACSKKELLTFIYTRIKYPAEARKEGIEGMSVVQFTVMKDGSVGDISIKRSIGGGTDEAVLSVMDEMVLMEEKWTPGMQDGKPVNVRYTLPIRFKLDGPAKKTHPVKKQKEEKMDKEKVKSKPQLDQINVVGYGQNQKMDELVKEDFLSSMKVFPNPAQEEVNVEVNGPKSPLEIRVHDLSGKLLHRQMINDFNGTYKGTLRSENFINTQAIISFIQDGKVQSQQIIFSK